MLGWRLTEILLLGLAGVCLCATGSWGARPTAAELAHRDQWVRAHLPARLPRAAPPPRPDQPPPELMVWTSYGPVYPNDIEGRPLQIAGQTYEHSLYCHAHSRIQVRLPVPAMSFAATLGILTNPRSVGGSVVVSLESAGEQVYASPVLHRDEPGIPVEVDLGGAREFFVNVGSAGDGIASDQTVLGSARVTLADGRQLWLSDLPLRDPLTQPRGAGTPPFSFTYGGRHSDELLPGWQRSEERVASQPGTTCRRRSYTDPHTGLCVTCTVITYAAFPTVEWTLSFKNTGTRDTPLLAGILPLDTRFERGAAGEFVLHHFTGSPCTAGDYEPFETRLGPGDSRRISTDGGRPTNSNLPYFNLETGAGGVIAVVGWAGQWAAQFTRDEGRGLRVTGGQEATSFRLHPGEEVRSPLAVLQFYGGDWLTAQNVWRSWMLAHNAPRRGGKLLQPFVYVCNGGYFDGLMTTAEGEKEFLRRTFEEDIHPSYWDQDAGWYPCDGAGWPKTGTWEVDPKRWPNGIREVSDWLRARGCGTILWFEPERVAGGSWLAEHHPEWIHGGAGGGLLKLGEPDCRAWITDRVDALLTSEGVDFYRQDFNIDPLYYWRSEDAADRQGITEIRHVEGYFAYWDELVRRHPALWIDTCASGGRRNDLETLRRAVPILRSDFTSETANADPSDQQNHTYGVSFWMPYNGTGYMHLDPYMVRSLFTTIHGIGVDWRRKDIDYHLLRELYHEWQRIAPCFLGDYWPLTPYHKGTDAWVAWQFDRPDTGAGVVQAFRRQTCPAESITLKLRGLDPGARYELTDLDTQAPRVAAGRELLQTGLTLTAPQSPAALLVSYRRMADRG